MTWSRPARFQRVCPLLVPTKDGLRCSANTREVRPFWARAFGFYGGALASTYLVGVIVVFIFLRTIGYPVSIFHVALPPLWHRVGQARGWFFLQQSNRAFSEGKTAEGLLYLANSYDFDPQNYAAGMALAKNLQAGQPTRSDEVFQKLLQDHPEKRHATAHEWFRALLPRGNFNQITLLARDELLTDQAHAGVWVRAFLFATRQTGRDETLRELAASPAPAAQLWRAVFETELLLRSRRTAEARAKLGGSWPADPRTRFATFYRIKALLELRDPYGAFDLLPTLPDVEAKTMLQLDAYAVADARNLLQKEINELLAPRFTSENLWVATILCAHLIRHPDPAALDQLHAKLTRENVPLTTDTAGVWFALLCTAGATGDQARLHEVTLQLKLASKTPFLALNAVEAFFRGQTPDRRLSAYLPILPLPLEVTYALYEKVGQPTVAAPALPQKKG